MAYGGSVNGRGGAPGEHLRGIGSLMALGGRVVGLGSLMALGGRVVGLGSLGALGGRVVVTALRLSNDVIGAAVDAGIVLERRALDVVLESDELERVLLAAIDSPRLQLALSHALDSRGAERLVDGFFESGIFDRVIDRLLEAESLWHLVDEIAASPAVTAAISQQGLSFADQVGEEARSRSRSADDWLERAAHRLVRRRERRSPAEPDPSTT